MYQTSPAPPGPPNSRAGRRGGFTILEITVAISLMAVVALSVLLTFAPLARHSRLSKEMETAAAEVTNFLEQFQTTPYDQALAAFPDGQVLPVPALASGQVSCVYEDVDADPLVLSLQLTWESPDAGTMTRDFTAVKTR